MTGESSLEQYLLVKEYLIYSVLLINPIIITCILPDGVCQGRPCYSLMSSSNPFNMGLDSNANRPSSSHGLQYHLLTYSFRSFWIMKEV